MGLYCPRCGKQNIGLLDEELDLSPADAHFKFPQHQCQDCFTRFYFYEDVVGYMATMQKIREGKKPA